MPGRDSTPLDTSTPNGRTSCDGGGDVVRREAAGEDESRRARAIGCAAGQSAGTPAARRAFEQERRRQRLRLDARRRAARAASRDRAAACSRARSSTSVCSTSGLKTDRISSTAAASGWRVTAKQRTRPRAAREQRGALRRDLPLRLGEHEADRVDPRIEGRLDGFGRGHAADLDPHAGAHLPCAPRAVEDYGAGRLGPRSACR